MRYKTRAAILLFICLILVSLGINRAYRDVQTVPVQLSASLNHFYKKNISPCGAPECAFYPSCSEYSKEAIEEHGLMQGWAMSFDRMTRCNNEMWVYPEVLIEEQVMKYDPVPCKSSELP